MPSTAPIASRTLVLVEDGKTHSVEVTIFKPQEVGVDDFVCCYEIRWPDHTKTSQCPGIDAIDALYSVLLKIGIELNCSEASKSGRLGFYEIGEGVGFPVTKNIRDLLRGTDAKIF